MTHRGPFQPLLFCDSVISDLSPLHLFLFDGGRDTFLFCRALNHSAICTSWGGQSSCKGMTKVTRRIYRNNKSSAETESPRKHLSAHMTLYSNEIVHQSSLTVNIPWSLEMLALVYSNQVRKATWAPVSSCRYCGCQDGTCRLIFTDKAKTKFYFPWLKGTMRPHSFSESCLYIV